ncbi:AMP-binding protein [Photobacterium kasasachensis]|uniref:AMP-binding protein n=1 Tax=Photobacterium kasasachensis TaxID=2910240 RepID=UPI003D102772
MNIPSLATLMSQPHEDTHIVAISATETLDWAQFRTDVSVLSQALQHSEHQRWALCFEDSYFFAVAFLAAAHAGRHLILPGNHQPAALAELAPHYDAILHDDIASMTSDSMVGCLASGLAQQAVTGHSNIIQSTVKSDAFKRLTLSDIPLTLFTSGSNGPPKAIEKTLALLDAELAQLEAIWGEQLINATISSTVSHQHIYGLLFRILWPLCAGRAFERHDLIYPEQVMTHANEETVLISSPALLKRLTEESPTQPYRAIFSSGGPLPLAAARQSHTLFEQLPFEVFGSTETGGIGYRQQIVESTPWQLFPALSMKLNAEGCLRVLSPFINTKQWYQTSDQCQCLTENTFMLKGRADRIVKIEEKRISLTDVEHRLCQLAWIEEAAVLPLEETQRLSLVAVITLTPSGHELMAEIGKGKFWLMLRQSLRRWIEPVGVPRRYRTVDEIPLNSQGKRLVRDLEQLFTG